MTDPQTPIQFEWMRVALAYLYDQCSDDDVMESLRDPTQLAKFRSQFESFGAQSGQRETIPEGSQGDNLLQGLMALRFKFERADAEAKLEINIAMREGRK